MLIERRWKELTSYEYGDEATVTSIINSTAGDTNAVKIPRALVQAEGVIDATLAPWTEVPIADPPQILKDVANDWAAGIIRDEGTNPTSENPPPNAFSKRAKDNLATYMISKGWTPPAEGEDGGAPTPTVPPDTVPIAVRRYGD
jgi:hypothetical protein